MDRPMTTWEQGVVGALLSVDATGLDLARESAEHLLVTGVCECESAA